MWTDGRTERTARIAAALALCTLAACALLGGTSAALPEHGSAESVGIDGVTTNGTATNGTATNGTATNGTTTGTSLVVRGVTNRQPDEAAVLLSLRATNGTTTRLTSAQTWGWDGEWTAAFDLDGVPPGVYRIEATTGDDTDVEYVRLGTSDAKSDANETDTNGTDVGAAR
ncbi:hypothetical protein [Halarchaeum nitratireducens]|uniref:Uncharacterized protein n=1 Tax=Halarchaeum nitratireducens TaxID=489913 RepID=A0A830G901_9EURY|nr:hypothetical protein [Halarchaeum nitratireducens]GGN09506.1 hypothetical protein GCM10009021_06330 [Halarchaeum nitratireducens]